MNIKASGPAKTVGVSKLVPDDIAQLIGEPPLISGEKREDYDRLFAAFVVDLAPTTNIEWLILRDIVHASWESVRLRGVKTQLINASMVDAFTAVVSQAIEIKKEMSGFDADAEAQRMLVRSYESVAGYEAVTKIISAVGLDLKAIPAMAVADCFDLIERLDASVFHHEKLRDRSLLDFNQRRAERSAREKLAARGTHHLAVADAVEAAE